MEVSRILLATDFSEPSAAALQLATALARDSNAHLLICHVMPPEFVYAADEMDAVAVPFENPGIRQTLAKTRPDDPRIKCEHHLLVGNPAEEIVRFAEDQNVDLIVLGSHGRTGAARLVMGSVAEAVVRKAACPVLTIKHRRPAAGQKPD
jgi:nucleotide-binding universal stress UspA family protein